MKRSIALSILLAGISVTALTRAEMPDAYSRGDINPYAGKSGDGLLAAIRRTARPSRLVSLEQVSYVFYDPFDDCAVEMSSGHLPSGYLAGTIVPSSWWDDKSRADSVGRDLHNFIPLTPQAANALAERRPGVLSIVTTDFGRWSIGHAEVYGSLTDLYAPPLELRGRLARTYFYMAAMYHADMLTAEGYMMLRPDYPYLTPYAIGLLREWARDCEPDEAEKDWDDYVARMQGCGNPFVAYPSLADYVWGDKAGEIYAEEGEPVPLHSTYYMDTDRVYLLSPHVPDDARWTIDGTPAMSDSYDPRDLGAGDHHLAYTSASTGRSGRLMIKIVGK